MAIFFDSSYVLDDENFVRVFKDLKKNGLKNIVDFNGAYISLTERLKFFLIPEIIRQNNFLRKILKKKDFLHIAIKENFTDTLEQEENYMIYIKKLVGK